MSFGPKKAPTGMTGGKPRRKKVVPAWIKAIPQSEAHGSGHLQKRLWRLTSDYIRIRDWYKYKRCVATGKRIDHWKDGQAGHYIPYSKCNGLYKFNENNIHLQGAASNSWGGFNEGRKFGLELARRGIDTDFLETENRMHHGTQIRDAEVIEKMEDILEKMKDLPEHPPYLERAWELLCAYQVRD